MKLTREEIEAKRTPAGGFTRKQMEEWGVPWPPTTGWMDRLLRGEKTNPTPSKTELAARKSKAYNPRYTGPEPTSPEFDSTKHGLLAPPIVTYKRIA